MKEKYKVLDLFSGLGGFSLGLERTGHFRTVAFCDNNKFSKAILDKHWKGIKIYDDVREITKERLQADGIEFPDIVTGGFPCQPFSVAGQQKGTSDDRHLWPEMFRIIEAFKPRFVIGENVRGIVNIQDGVVFETVCTNLEDEGYEIQPFNIPAAGVGAPHRRERIWFIAVREDVANTIGEYEGREISRSDEETRRIQEEYRQNNSAPRKSSRTSEIRNGDNGYEKRINVADTNDEGLRTRIGRSDNDHETESRIGRTDRARGSSDVERHDPTSTEVEGMDVADTESFRAGKIRYPNQEEGSEGSSTTQLDGSRGDVADTNSERLQRTEQFETHRGETETQFSTTQSFETKRNHWESEPDVGRVAHGISGRVHRLKGLGNSIVPQIVEEIGKALIKAERE
jgi:DNA (cytosine-5)-methyltransferase 1